MTALRELLVSARASADTATWECPAGYRQGRGAWGGLPVGAMLDAVMALADDPGLVPRSLTAHLLGPVAAGTTTITLTPLRRGSATLTVAALMRGREGGPDGEPTGEEVVLADAVVVLGSARAADVDLVAPGTITPPDELATGWQAVPEVSLPAGLGPEFFSNLHVRPIAGFPGTGAERAETLGWISPPEGVTADPVVLACLADGWWPGVLLPQQGMRPVATLAFSLDLIALPSTDEPLLHRGRMLSGADGYACETRELWSADGRLLAHNQQTMVVIR